ncbi:MAG TPA: hypothetical protein VJA21_27795 [Verrucomicrobiae bacterium]
MAQRLRGHALVKPRGPGGLPNGVLESRVQHMMPSAQALPAQLGRYFETFRQVIVFARK